MKIISVDHLDGVVTYEIEHSRGKLREQLSVADYPTSEAILARIAERETQITKEVKQPPTIPADITAMADLEFNG